MTGVAISGLMESDAFVNLVCQGFSGDAVARVECSIVTERTASSSYLSVTVGTRKTSIYDELLETLAIDALVISYKSIVSLPFREIRVHRAGLFLSVPLGNDGAELLVESIKLLIHLLAEACEPVLPVLLLHLGIGLVLHIIVKVNGGVLDIHHLVSALVRIDGYEQCAVVDKLADEVLDLFLEIS